MHMQHKFETSFIETASEVKSESALAPGQTGPIAFKLSKLCIGGGSSRSQSCRPCRPLCLPFSSHNIIIIIILLRVDQIDTRFNFYQN